LTSDAFEIFILLGYFFIENKIKATSRKSILNLKTFSKALLPTALEGIKYLIVAGRKNPICCIASGYLISSFYRVG